MPRKVPGIHSRPVNLSYVALFVAAFGISTSAILIRWSSSGPVTIAFYRMSLTTVLLTPFALLRWKELAALAPRVWFAVLVTGFILATHFSLFIASVKETSVAASVLLATIHPLFIGPFSHFVFRERLSRLNAMGILIAFSGMVVLIGGDLLGSGGSNFKGNMMGLAAGICAGLYYICGRILRTGKYGMAGNVRVPENAIASPDGENADERKTADNGPDDGGAGMSIQVYAWLVYGFCSIFLFFFCILTGSSLEVSGMNEYYLFAAMAIFPTLLGHTLQNWSLRHLPAYIVSVSLLFEPVGSSILAAFILDEIPVFTTYVGGAVILTGILMAMKRKVVAGIANGSVNGAGR